MDLFPSSFVLRRTIPTLVVDYLITGDEQRAIHFSLEMLKGTAPVVTKDFTTNIPVQRNYLTTILGNLLTVGGTIDVDIQEGFKNEWIEGEEWWNPEEITPSQPAYDEQTNTYSVYTREEFAWLPTHIDDMLTATPYLQRYRYERCRVEPDLSRFQR